MAFCSKCGKQLDESSKFCTGCGTPVGTVQTNQNGSVRPEYSTAQVRKTDFSEDFTHDDKRENRAVAAVSYVGPMFFLPLVATPNSKFARFHANQGVALFMLSLAYSVVYKALLWFFSEILIGAALTKFSFSYFGYGAATTVYGIIRNHEEGLVNIRHRNAAAAMPSAISMPCAKEVLSESFPNGRDRIARMASPQMFTI